MNRQNLFPQLAVAAMATATLFLGCNKNNVINNEPYEPSAPSEIVADTTSNIYGLRFPTPSMFHGSSTRYTFAGRTLLISPELGALKGESFSWTVNGQKVSETTSMLRFTPDKAGESTITVTVDGLASTTLKVVCVDATENERFREGSSSNVAKVLEWVPAPGQFINENEIFKTHAEAVAWAQKQLDKNYTVSLGAFGGYIVVGFTHSVVNRTNAIDFAIMGNAFLKTETGVGGSNEPGIVYVMQDTNGNGLPDDEWYELRGSESGCEQTIQNYAITYRRPTSNKSDVEWTDIFGREGKVDYVEAFHAQDTYYPAWIDADSYTLKGTRLAARTTRDNETGQWSSFPFEWGYADNIGNDALSDFAPRQAAGFDIDNAMNGDGSPVKLQYIDFIKIQTGVSAQSGHLGEVSTEVCGVIAELNK